MRIPVAIALALCLPCVAAAGPIRVEVETAAEPPDPFLVQVYGHYADFHLGYSRHWKDALIPAGDRRSIGLGPVNPLINMGVSVTVYHPEYVSQRARSKRTPLLLRPVGFETFRPTPWRAVLEAGHARPAPQGAPGGPPLPERAFDNGGPAHALGQVVGHLQLFLLSYLPALDAAGGDAAAEARLEGYLELFGELVRFAREAPPLSGGWAARKRREEPAFDRAMARQELEQVALAEELLFRTGEWLSISRAERVTVRRFQQEMRYGRPLAEALMTAEDRDRVSEFLERHAEDRRARREPERTTSWINPDNRIAYRVSVLEPRGGCARLGITADLTGVVPADLGDMTHGVRVRFCRSGSGEWRLERS